MSRSISSIGRDCLARLLRELRKQAGLTQRDLAPRLGQPQSFVSKYERGERCLDLVELDEICSALGAELDRLVKRFKQAVKAELAAHRKPDPKAAAEKAREQPAKIRKPFRW